MKGARNDDIQRTTGDCNSFAFGNVSARTAFIYLLLQFSTNSCTFVVGAFFCCCIYSSHKIYLAPKQRWIESCMAVLSLCRVQVINVHDDNNAELHCGP